MKNSLKLPKLPPESLKRYAPNIEFPPYAFAPGHGAHPFRDPQGHSYKKPKPPQWLLPLSEKNYGTHEGYLYGMDLFNHGYWWECHELWEDIWKKTKNMDINALLQSLIQMGAALLNSQLGPHKDQAIRNLVVDIEKRLEPLKNPFLGVDHKKLLSELKTALQPLLSTSILKMEESRLVENKIPRILLIF